MTSSTRSESISLWIQSVADFKTRRKPLAARDRNIMPPSQSQDTKRRRSPRKKTREEPETDQQIIQGLAGDENENNQGFSQSSTTALTMLSKAVFPQPLASDIVSTVPSTTMSSKTRSTSPVKSASDLLFATRPVRFYNIGEILIPQDVEELDKTLQKAQDSIEIIPTTIQAEVGAHHQGELRRHWLDANCTDSRETLLRELSEIVEIVESVAFHQTSEAAEPAWNEDVHRPMLRRALQPYRGIRCYNITTAKPCPQFSETTISGLQQGRKLVDYSINIEHSYNSDMETRTRMLLRRQPREIWTITQTNYPPVRMKPAAISIETKSAGGSLEDAKTQLATWAAAHFARLRSLLKPGVRLPTHPLLLISPTSFAIYYAIDRPEAQEIAILHTVDLGSARTVVNMYKQFAALKLLGKWASVYYRKWVEDVLLGDQNLYW